MGVCYCYTGNEGSGPPRMSSEMLSYLGLSSNGAKSSVTDIATTNEGIWETTDDYGITYYFKGNVTNNYVKFAGYYWRIVRINGDGSIRLIYDGTSAYANGESSSDRQIGTSQYNSNANDNTYIGYMYGSRGVSSYSQTHSNIKTTIDNWYKANIIDKGYDDKIADVIYCNDRQTVSGMSGYGTNKTVYASGSRLVTISMSWDSTQEIEMICSQKNDAFTVDDTSKGNGALTYPVGLLTVDEALAGGAMGGTANDSYYLYTGYDFWTMSPRYFVGTSASVFYVGHNGNVSSNGGHNSYAIRLVLSLKSNIELSGSGTMTDPYMVQD